jgi:serine/threonine protein kinase/tetratricopeptide (TPR) repeat protein
MKDWEEIERLFHLALERAPEEREGFLEQECGDDPELLEEVKALLSCRAEEGHFLEMPPLEWLTERSADIKKQQRPGESEDSKSPSPRVDLDAAEVGPLLGRVIGRYKILKKLGQGGMGEVFLAEDTSLDRKVALKFLPPLLQDDESAHRRFVREAKAVAALDHPFICNIHEVGETRDGQDFIVMEYVEGRTLRDKLANGPLPVKEALRVAMEVAEALEKAHKAGIIHRDLKPANIMLMREGHAKVLDFGLAKKVVQEDGTEQDISSALTREGARLGTPAYMSPEQVKAEPVDHRSDIFSFGIVLYEMLTGIHPFRRRSAVETGSAILTDPPPPLPESLSRSLRQSVEKMLEKRPDDRFQSLPEVRASLTGSAKNEGKAEWNSRRIWVGLLSIIVIIALVAVWQLALLEEPAPSESRNLVAVLPFQNLSPDPDKEWFSDGMTEEIIGALSKIGSLNVISRTSVMRYKLGERSVKEIAMELGTDTLLEGSARLAEDRVRITAQLIDARTDQPLWANTYDRALAGIFEIQADVARQIARALEMELTSKEEERILVPPTEDLEAYRLYLQGLHLRYRDNDPRNLDEATRYLQSAIEQDPNYALAYALLAQVHFLKEYWIPYWEPPDESRQQATRAAEKAVELDETLSEVHVSMGVLREFYDGDWRGAAGHFRRAIELNPGYWSGHWEYGLLLSRTGRHEMAVSEFEAAHRLDPVSIQSNAWLTLAYLRVGMIDRARETASDLVVLQPNSGIGFVFLAHIYILEGKCDAAREQLSLAKERSEGWRYFTELGYLEAMTGNTAEALRCVEGITQLLGETRLASLLIAKVYLGLGDNDAVFEWLARSGLALVDLKIDPRWEVLREDPRFADLLHSIGLEPDQPQ